MLREANTEVASGGGGGNVGVERGGVGFVLISIRWPECGGGDGGGVLVAIAIRVGRVFRQTFEVARALAGDDGVELVRLCAVGESADGLDGAVCGVTMPSVYLLVGVVGHERERAVRQHENGTRVRLALHGAGDDATCLGCDVVSKDGEVCGGVGVGVPVIAVLVEATRATLDVEDAVDGLDGGYVGGADTSVIDNAGGGGGDAFTAGVDNPLCILRAEHDDLATREHPAYVRLCGCGHGEVEGGGVEFACGEVVEVVCSRHPDGLGLGFGGSEDEAGLVNAGEGGVTEAGIESAP